VAQNILIMDLSGAGHHPRYVCWIVGAQGCRDAEVMVGGPSELLEHAELRGLTTEFCGHAIMLSGARRRKLESMQSAAALLRRQFTVRKIWQEAFREISRKRRIDLVMLPWADDCLDAIGLLGSPFGETRWMGIALRPMFHFQKVGVTAPARRFSALREALFRRALRERHLAGLFSIDPTLVEFARSQFDIREREKLWFLPDPAVEHKLQPRAEARRVLDIPNDARVVLGYGALSARKGIGPLIEGAADPDCPSDIHILLAGGQSPDVGPIMQSASANVLRGQERLHIREGYQNDAAEATLLAASDCVWVGYRGFYTMSGVLLLAARHGIPCIVSDAGLAAYLMKKHEFGLIVDPDDPTSVVEALRYISVQPQELWRAGDRGRSAFSRHTVAEFQSEISRMIVGA
jgi:glycosyltransferase involved in cell wall biosynthesis